MVVLGADDNTLNKYKVLHREDLAASTAVADPNAPGQSQAELPWIWQSFTHSNGPEFMFERMFIALTIHSNLMWS